MALIPIKYGNYIKNGLKQKFFPITSEEAVYDSGTGVSLKQKLIGINSYNQLKTENWNINGRVIGEGDLTFSDPSLIRVSKRSGVCTLSFNLNGTVTKGYADLLFLELPESYWPKYDIVKNIITQQGHPVLIFVGGNGKITYNCLGNTGTNIWLARTEITYVTAAE